MVPSSLVSSEGSNGGTGVHQSDRIYRGEYMVVGRRQDKKKRMGMRGIKMQGK
jgi:hypothetical protein